jgi:hypothetical protein
LEKYNGKIIEVEGPIEFANTWISERVIILAGAKKNPGDLLGVNIHCVPLGGEKDKAWWLGKGQKVKVTGEVVGVNATGIGLQQCTFQESEPNPTMKVSAEQLTADFSKDEAAAKKKYLADGILPKEIIVEGTIGDLVKSKNDFYIAKLSGTDGVTVDCTVSKRAWEGLKKGQKVSVKGDCSGFEKKDKEVTVNSAFVLN